MDMERFWRWVRGDVPPVRACDQAVARQAYADYLHAQIVGFAPTNADVLLEKLTTSSDADSPCVTAPFPELMGVETKLVEAISDDLIDRTYWIVRERFNRVVGPAAIAQHLAWSPAALAEPAKAPVAETIPSRDTLSPAISDDPATVDPDTLASDAADREAALRRDQSAEIAAHEAQGGAADAATSDDMAQAPASDVAQQEKP